MVQTPVLCLAIGMCALVGCDAGEPTKGAVDAQASIDVPPAIDGALGGGTLEGTVARTAQPMGDARGHVYVALFDKDPVINMASAQVIARVRLADADLASLGATVAYSLTNIPPRTADYFLLAFLDDNANVDPMSASAGPDRGDLVSLDGLAAPRVKVNGGGTQTENITLNSVLPF